MQCPHWVKFPISYSHKIEYAHGAKNVKLHMSPRKHFINTKKVINSGETS